ncbi:hypothetical protein NC652_017311 [Populus alba x Populus x berolinensis]|nr:hypothetical protein NC652_017311 [Populus alba x Populus x berolinensis]
MHKYNQFGYYDQTQLLILYHNFYKTFLSLSYPSLYYRKRKRRNREELIINNKFFYKATHDIHINLLFTSTCSIG